VEKQPGVTSVTFTANVPLTEGHRMSFGFIAEGQPTLDTAMAPQAQMRIVTGSFFKTVGVPLLRGRTFDDRDRTGTEEVAVISRSFARRFWGDADPVGKRISGDAGASWIRVIGVAGDVRDQALDKEPTDAFYVPFGQYPTGGNLLIRSSADLLVLARNVTAAAHAIDPDLPVDAIRTRSEIRLDSLAPRRLTASLLTLFGLLALLIAATGIGGVLAFSVSQRTREIGVRVALGAQRGEVLSLVLRQGGTMVVLGLVLGTIGALWLSRFMQSLVYNIEARDPLTLGAACLTLAAVGVIASLGPARRATSVDPVIALRNG
jgi:putative ABC transport system permease protein